MAKRKRDDNEQSQRFVDTARALDADESGECFDRAMDDIAHAPEAEIDAETPGDQNNSQAGKSPP